MITPIGVNEADWFDMTTADLVQYGTVPRYSGDWRECAASWLLMSQISQLNIPRPEAFGDWREWASRFNQVIFG